MTFVAASPAPKNLSAEFFAASGTQTLAAARPTMLSPPLPGSLQLQLSEWLGRTIQTDSYLVLKLPNPFLHKRETDRLTGIYAATCALSTFGTPLALSPCVSRKANEAFRREFQALTGSQIQGSATGAPKEEL